jgi:hypothetical protein
MKRTKEDMPIEPYVTKVNTEVAEFSDGTSVLRQRPYINPLFAGLRPKHAIIGSDQFRLAFAEGTPLSEAQKGLANPETLEIDGDPGSPWGKALRP